MATRYVALFNSQEIEPIEWDDEQSHEVNFKMAGFTKDLDHIEPVYYAHANQWWKIKEYINEQDRCSIFLLEDGESILLEFICYSASSRFECLSQIMEFLERRLRVEKMLKEFVDDEERNS